jgi:hypothetical protein
MYEHRNVLISVTISSLLNWIYIYLGSVNFHENIDSGRLGECGTASEELPGSSCSLVKLITDGHCLGAEPCERSSASHVTRMTERE